MSSAPPDAAASEFDLIRRHFTRNATHTDLAIGDDAALIRARPGMQLAVSTDMLVSGTHFLADTDPEDLGWKTLAVNVSDLAAMGAEPRWAFLALALPAADEVWIEAFARGLFACADAFGVDLAGGDTTRGPLNLALTIIGEVPQGAAITRAGARAGEDLWVSGQPGRAALGLAALRTELSLNAVSRHECIAALQRPQPRSALGQALRGVASAMLDVSDGLLGDLSHLLERSGVGAVIDAPSLPLPALLATGAPASSARHCLLCGGDDYELLFTAAPGARAAVDALAARLGVALHRIGFITTQHGEIMLREAGGHSVSLAAAGYDHFASNAAPS